MKTKIILMGLVTAIAFLGEVKGQTAREGDAFIDAYYGWPNLFTTVLKTTYANSGTESDVKIGGFGPAGGRFEYMVSDKVGIGADIFYAATSIEWKESSTSNSSVIYDYKVSVPRLTALFRMNFHFSNSDVVDPYFGIGAGYKNTTYKWETNDPDYTNEKISGVPIGFRLAVGLRYLFNEKMGLNAELGLGGALLSAGLTFKL